MKPSWVGCPHGKACWISCRDDLEKILAGSKELPTSGESLNYAGPWHQFLRERGTMGWKNEVFSSAQAFVLAGDGLNHYHSVQHSAESIPCLWGGSRGALTYRLPKPSTHLPAHI